MAGVDFVTDVAGGGGICGVSRLWRREWFVLDIAVV